MRNPEYVQSPREEAKELVDQQIKQENTPSVDGKQEVERKVLELFDKDGNKICEAVIGYEKEIVPIIIENGSLMREAGVSANGRILQSWILKGRRDDKDVEIDVIELTNRCNVKIIEIEGMMAGGYLHELRIVVTRPIKNFDDFGLLLHELGHAEQFSENRFQKISKLHLLDEDDFFSNINDVVEAIPELKNVVSRQELESFSKGWNELLKSLEEIEKKRDELLKQIGELSLLYQDRGMHKRYENGVTRIMEDLLPLDDIRKKKKNVFENEFAPILATLRLSISAPVKLLERDATKRAMQWMREIRDQIGVSIYSDYRQDFHGSSKMMEELKEGLRSYGADKNPLKHLKKQENADYKDNETKTRPI